LQNVEGPAALFDFELFEWAQALEGISDFGFLPALKCAEMTEKQ